MTTTDQTNRTVEIPDAPLRIISLVPSQTELLYYLKLDKEVVGITKFCVHPTAWFKNKTRVGGTKKYHFDRIEALAPNLIIANKEENDKEQILQLAKQYPVWVSDVKDLADANQMIRSIGEITHTKPLADDLADNIQTGFSKLKDQVANRPKLRVLYLIWQKPYMTIGGDTFINDIIESTGWINCYADQNRYPTLTETEITDLRPDLILLSSEPFPFKEKHILEISKLCPTAVIKLVDGEYFSWYGSRLLQTSEYLRNLV